MRAIALATAVSAALVVTYLALGGASYSPASVADPCASRDWRDPEGVQEVAQQIVLSALDDVACELGTSREDVVLAFASRASLEQFADEHGLSNARVEELVRSGLVRAIDEAERADALNPTFAGVLRTLAERVPIDELLDLLDRLRGLPGLR
jgi:hypothetical protein